MRAGFVVFGAAALALSVGGAQAQSRPGQYGGGFVEYLLAGGDMGARGAPTRPASSGYGGQGSPATAAGYADPRVAARQPMLAPTARHAALAGNPYEDPAYADAMTGPRAAPAYAQPPQAYAEPAAIARAPDPRYARAVVPYLGGRKPGTIVVDTGSRYLYLVQPGGQAIRYGIGVGRPGFLWHGIKTISAKKEWPDWTPPPEMMQRRPDLPTHMVGGPENPLGARALYLGSSLFRIHGTNEPHTIGQAVSSGCIRMMNEDVVDLYERTPVGTRVEVI